MVAARQEKVLVIEDDKNLLTMLSRKLEAEGFSVLTATDGEQATTVAKKERPDILLIDILIPKKNGIAVLREIRATDWGEDTPAIFITNLNNMPQEEDMSGLKKWSHVVKANVSIADIVRMVKEKLAA